MFVVLSIFFVVLCVRFGSVLVSMIVLLVSMFCGVFGVGGFFGYVILFGVCNCLIIVWLCFFVKNW